MMQLKDNMSNIEKIRQEIERRIENYWSDGDVDSVVVSGELEELIDFIDSMPEETSCIYDTNKLTPTPSVNIEDVARVQFASHAHVFDRKRKAVFDWEQFKEVAGIFYGFGKRDSLPEEKPSEDFPTSDEEVAKFLATHPKVEVPEKYKTPNWLFDKQPSEDLEEAANDSWVLYEYRDTPQGLYSSCYRDGFIAGAEWALNQGVKATGMISPRGIIYDNNIGYRLFLERYHNGDKVEVQVRKIEENGK